MGRKPKKPNPKHDRTWWQRYRCWRAQLVEDDLYYYDEGLAERPVLFFRHYLVHYQGSVAGQPFEPLGWQADVLRDVHGWRRRSDGAPRFARVVWEGPRGMGKSSYLAGLCLYDILGAGTSAAEAYVTSVTSSTATACFDVVRDLALVSPKLAGKLHVTKYAVTHERSLSKCQVLNGQRASRPGLKPSLQIIDESQTIRDSKLIETLLSGEIKRPGCQTWIVANAGNDRTSVAYDYRKQAERVLTGESRDETLYPMLCGLLPDEDPDDEENWLLAHPTIGTLVRLEDVRRQHASAKESESAMRAFRQYVLSQWSGSTTSWLDGGQWDRLEAPDDVDLDEVFRRNRTFAGIDLSSSRDCSSLVLACVEANTLYLKAHHWLPSHAAESRDESEATPWLTWAKRGEIELIPGPRIDPDVISAKVIEWCNDFGVAAVAGDSYHAVTVSKAIQEAGIEYLVTPQGYGLNAALQEIERRVAGGTLRHDGNVVSNWMVGHAEVRTDTVQRIALVKPGDWRRQIDYLAAAASAVSQLIVSGEVEDAGVAEWDGTVEFV